MNYNQALVYLMNQLPMYQRIGKAAYRSGLENTHLLDTYFENPHRHFRTIHVAGTNGKGSVSHMLASILQEAGYTVGLYTSPHLLDFRERIKINGKPISKKAVAEFVNHHKAYFDTLNASFFEISVFMAFHYFMIRKVDVAVVEVGLGGRLDSTNIIIPVLSVITNIGKDHTEFLGNTIAKIAREKAGIIKHKVPIVIGESRKETRRLFINLADALHAPIVFADKLYAIDRNSISVDGYPVFNITRDNKLCYSELRCELLGHYQRRNIITVLAAVFILGEAGFYITDKDVYSGIGNVVKNTGLYGRWQVIAGTPTIICDAAHNAEGIRLVMRQIVETVSGNLHIIIGFVNDKDLNGILKHLPPKAYYYFSRLSVPRTMDEKSLMNKAVQWGLKGESHPSVTDAFESARKRSGPDDIILVTGSTFCVADFLTIMSTYSPIRGTDRHQHQTHKLTKTV